MQNTVFLMHYQNSACPALATLLSGNDAVNYSVLKTIVCGTCSDIFTDGENVILCYSTAPNPVWIWTREINDALTAAAAKCLKEHFPLEKGFGFIADRPLLEALRQHDSYFENTAVTLRLCSHMLQEMTAADRIPAGNAEPAAAADTALLVSMYQAMEREAEGMELPQEMCTEKITGLIAQNALFVWRTTQGDITALASRDNCPPYSKISTVYTLPQHRRKGYAEAVVRHVCREILADGLTPILYTDGDYEASNACYRKIGFIQQAELCTVKKA